MGARRCRPALIASVAATGVRPILPAMTGSSPLTCSPTGPRPRCWPRWPPDVIQLHWSQWGDGRDRLLSHGAPPLLPAASCLPSRPSRTSFPRDLSSTEASGGLRRQVRFRQTDQVRSARRVLRGEPRCLLGGPRLHPVRCCREGPISMLCDGGLGGECGILLVLGGGRAA